MPHRRWFVQKTNPEYIEYLSKTTSISPAFAQILINRGIKTPAEVRVFLDPSLSRLNDPLELQGIKEATEIIKKAVRDKKRILVHGDYDTDGITGTAILFSTLKKMGADVLYFIPDRRLHGYGFNRPGVEFAAESGVRLIITVDCGITSFKAVKESSDRGIGVVITDHHEPAKDDSGKTVLPGAAALINPKIDDALSIISGSTVAFKLAAALIGMDNALDMIDLASLGTIADVVPLVGENRVIVKEGLRLINESPRTGISAMKDVSGLNGRKLTAGLLSFSLIPRLNASGRIDNANDVIKMLVTENYNEAIALARRLNDLNKKRQQIEEEIYQEALAMLKEKGHDFSIVLASEGWHEGVVGIVASRLADAYYRPAFIFGITDGIAKGSARSIPPLDLYHGISLCKDILLSFGGHRQAAGLKLRAGDVELFETRMNRIIPDSLTDSDLVPTLKIDASVAFREVGFSLVREIDLMEPLGFGNSSPVLGTRGLEAVGPKIVGNKHLKMRLKHRSYILDAIGFDMGDKADILDGTKLIDAVYTPTINVWERGRTLQLRLLSFRQSPL